MRQSTAPPTNCALTEPNESAEQVRVIAVNAPARENPTLFPAAPASRILTGVSRLSATSLDPISMTPTTLAVFPASGVTVTLEDERTCGICSVPSQLGSPAVTTSPVGKRTSTPPTVVEACTDTSPGNTAVRVPVPETNADKSSAASFTPNGTLTVELVGAFEPMKISG